MEPENKREWTIEDEMANDLTRSFPKADEELAAWRDATVAKLRAKGDARRERRRAGRKPKPESERRTIRFSVCFNAAEYRRVEAFVGSRETGEVLRELILGALPSEENAE